MHPDRPVDPRTTPGRGIRGTRGTRGITRVLVLAALVPVGCIGWLGWQSAAHSGRTTASAASTATSASGRGPAATAVPSPARPTAARKPLAGKVVVIDPGHNPDNVNYPSQINAPVWIGNGHTSCDTTGTSTDAGYPEADFTLDVARRVRTILQAEGATVVFTQDGNRPWGPCVTQRAAIGNQAHADAAISIHGDGAPAADHGFHVILPAAVDTGGADTLAIVAPSHTLGIDVRSAFAAATREPFADYVNGGTGMIVRSDLGGLNMSKVPKVFIECGNMRNATDAGRMTTPAWRQLAAQGIAAGLTAFLEAGH
jgi:N-acetylmuramoyl-L-alanine amidase